MLLNMHGGRQKDGNAVRCCMMIIPLVVAILVVPMRGQEKDAENKTKAQQLWEAAVAAKGGRERLGELQSLYVVSEDKFGSRDHELYVFPDRSFRYSYWASPERVDVVAYNGKRKVAWWQTDAHEAQVQDIETSASLIKKAQFTLLLVTRWLEPKPFGMRKERIGLKHVDVVQTDVDGWRVDYYLDSSTHLPSKVVYGYSKISRERGKMNREVRLDEYSETNGIMMPHKLMYSFTDGPEKSEQRVRYELNVQYDEQIFERAPTPGTKPDAWRVSKPSKIL